VDHNFEREIQRRKIRSSLTAAGVELVRYKSDLFCVQEVRWDKWGTVRARDNIFSMGKETKIIN